MASRTIHIRDMWDAVQDGTVPGTFSEDGEVFVFPTVESHRSRGDAKLLWTIRVRLLDSQESPVQITEQHLKQPVVQLPEGYKGELTVESCQEGGKIRDQVPTYVTRGKNLGKKNATNVITQALRDALSRYNRQRKTASKRSAAPAAAAAPAPTKEAEMPEMPALHAHAHAQEEKTGHRPPPMLVKKEGDTQDATLTPAMFERGVTLQEKLNGVRLVFYLSPDAEEVTPPQEAVVAYSRKGDPYPGLNHLRREIHPLLLNPPPITAEWLAEGTDRGYEEVSKEEVDAYYGGANRRVLVYVDGELFERGRSLRWISGQARKEKDEGTLKFWVFDVFFPGAKAAGYEMNSAMRQEYLDGLFGSAADVGAVLTHFVRLENHRVTTKDEVQAWLARIVEAGGEGVIVRKDWAPYRYGFNNYHSSNLVKLKPVYDDEFPVVGYREGKGKAAGMVIWVAEVKPEDVVDPKDKTFSADPKDMTHAERKWIFQCLSEIVEPDVDDGDDDDDSGGNGQLTRFERDFKGRPLTVEFAERSSKTGKPTQPKALTFRTYENGPAADPLARLFAECPPPWATG